MERIFYIISVFTFLLCFQFKGQAAIKFKFASMEVKGSDEVYLEHYNSLEIIVNGKPIDKKDKWIKVRGATNGLDEIVVLNEDSLGDRDTILAKLIDNRAYTFTFNPCSFYQIIPKGNENGCSRGYIRVISQDRDSTDWYFTTHMAAVSDSSIRNKDTTEYFEVFSSAYCPFAVKGFFMCNVDTYNEPVQRSSDICIGKVLWFTGSEQYSFIYDYQKRKVKIIFEGYSKKE